MNFLRCYLILFVCMATQNLYAVNNNVYISPKNSIAAGEYLAIQGGCNDCHTPNFQEKDGNVPKNTFLTGSNIGSKGPWGVSYAPNLRLLVQRISEKKWTDILKTGNGLPPMTWASTKRMNTNDIQSLYKYIKNLGPAGVEAPLSVGPNTAVKTDYYSFFPMQDKN